MAERFPVLIFASGKSTRMQQPKAMLQINGIPWIQQQATALSSLNFSNIFIVTNKDLYITLQKLCPNQIIILNEQDSLGPFFSIQLGIQSILKKFPSTSVFIKPVDIPVSDTEVWQQLESKIIPGILASIPSYSNKKGHPVCVSNNIARKIEKFDVYAENARLDYILRDIPEENKLICKVNDKKIILNINSPEDWERYLETYSGN